MNNGNYKDTSYNNKRNFFGVPCDDYLKRFVRQEFKAQCIQKKNEVLKTIKDMASFFHCKYIVSW